MAIPRNLANFATKLDTGGLVNGDSSTPSLTFSSDTNTGIYRSTTDTIGFAANGAAAATLSDTTFSLTGSATFRTYASTQNTSNAMLYMTSSNLTTNSPDVIVVERSYGVHPGRSSNYYSIRADINGADQDGSFTSAAISGRGNASYAAGVHGRGNTTSLAGFGLLGEALIGDTNGPGTCSGLRTITTQSGGPNPGNATYYGAVFTNHNYNNAHAIQWNSAYTGSQTQYFAYIIRNGVERGTITVTTSGTAYNTSSDYRLKENVQPLPNGLTRVLSLNPVQFSWKETGEISEGFLAHELQEHIPQAVTGQKDAVKQKPKEDERGVYVTDANGDVVMESKPDYQQVDTSFVVPHLVKAIQELNAKLESALQKIAVLEAK